MNHLSTQTGLRPAHPSALPTGPPARWVAWLLIVLLTTLTALVRAQTNPDSFSVTGACLNGTYALSKVGDNFESTGKPAYSGTGAVTINSTLYSDVPLALYYVPTGSAWVLAFDGQPYQSNASTALLPPATGWQAVPQNDGTVGVCEGSGPFRVLYATTVSSITRAGSSPTNAASVNYTVTFAADVTGLTASNFGLDARGGISGATVGTITGSGKTYTVSVNTGTGSGTLQLILANTQNLSPNVSNLPFSGDTYAVDKTGPTISSVAAPANGTYLSGQPLGFVVNFSEAVRVTGTPQVVVGIGSVNRTANYTSGSGSTALAFTYTVQNGDEDTDGITLGTALLLNGGTLRDAVGNNATLTLNGIPNTTGVLVDAVAPTVVSISRQSPTEATTNASSVRFFITFSESVTGITGNSFVLTNPTGTVTGNIAVIATTINGSNRIASVTVSGISGNGTLRLDVKSSGSGITDLAGNPLSGGFTTGEIYTIDQVAPTVAITSSAGANGGTTGASPIPFTVTFSESVTGFVAADLVVSGGTIASFAGSGTTYTLAVTPAADGLITINVPANVAQDGGNNGNMAASVFSITYSRPVTATPVVVTPATGSVVTATKPTYTGTATALTSLTLVVDDNTVAALTTTVDASGNWTITPLTDLAPGAHTVQARAQLGGQTASAYSPVNSFTVVVSATVATATPAGVNSSSATLGGSVTDAGAGIVRERGVVYVVGNGTPTTSDTKVVIGAGTGSFAQAVTSLLPATTYSVRAYAINQAGTSYGTTQPFMTVAGLNAVATATNVTCNGGANGSAQVNPSGGVAPYTYAWSPGNPAGQGTAQLTGLTAGSYSVLITDASGATLTRSVTVSQPSPVVVNIAPASTVVCGGSVVLTATTDAVNPSFAWTGTQPTTGTQVSVTSSGTYSVTVTSGSGCTATASSVVTINSLAATPVTTPVAVCQHAPPVSLATSVTASGGGTLRWYTDATGGSGSATAPVPPTTVVGQTIYYVSQVSSAGCESPRAALPFRVNALPVVTLTNDGPLSCAKPSVTLTAGGVADITGSSYRFSAGATQAGSTNLATVSMSGVYSVTATDGNGCSGTSETTVGSDQSNPQAGLTNDGPLTCAKLTVTLTAAGNGSYRFSAGATPVGTGNQATVTTGGVYSVTVTAPNGCSATAQTTVDVNSTVVAPTLTASALSTENAPISVTASGCSGTLNWTATGGTGTANGSVYTVTQPGNYTLTASCTVGSCTSSSAPSLTLQIRPGGFAISGVELVRCQLLDAGRGQYEISFTPRYSGLSGSPVTFGVISELTATTAPGPYTLRLYTDNATITLTASQTTAQASYRYNWLAACNSTQPTPNRPPVAQPIPDQVLVVGQPYQLELTTYFSDPDGQALTYTATGLPAGLQLSGSRISGSPTQAGSSSVQVTALDPGGLQAVGSVVLRVDPAPTTTPPGAFSLAGVTGVRCETLSVGQRQLSFSPVYTGLTGAPVNFGVTNELAMTTAPGPYSLRLYTDNPVITLTAAQGSAQATYRFEWLAACPTNPTTPPADNRPPVVGTGLANQTAQVGQGFTLFIATGTFTDPDNDPLQLSVSGLPAGLSFSAAQNAITGTPAQAGSSSVQVTATDPGGLSVSTSFVLTVQPATTPTPTPGAFSIAGVTGVRCETLSAGERQLSFSPVYTGLTGEPIRFGVVNELATTTAPGPYTLRLYTDNAAITLTATQNSMPVSYRFNWLAACQTNPNGRQAVAESGSQLSVVVLGNPVVGESVEVLIGGVAGQAVELSLSDVAGNRLHQQQIRQVSGWERVVVPISAGQAITILRVSTASQHQTVKLIRQ